MIQTTIPQVKLTRFEGPLDLLLYLIRQQEIEIHDIPIIEITHQYLAALDSMRELDLEVAGEFILMVAYLLYIKAQMLLPRGELEEAEDPRTPLVQKLLEYQKFKQIGEELRRIEDERKQWFPRGFDPSTIGLSETLQIDFNAFDLYRAYIEVIGSSEFAPPAYIRGTIVDLEEKIEAIRRRLAEAKEVTFLQLTKGLNRLHLVVTFIALLELAKRGILTAKQARPFETITLQYAENADA